MRRQPENWLKKRWYFLSIRQQFKKEVSGLSDYVALVTVSAKTYQESNIEIVGFLVDEQKIPGIYVTLNKPYDAVQRLLKGKNVNLDMVIFIDCITKVPENMKRQKNCLFIGSPEKLSDISVAMDQAVKSLPTKEKFIFFDSINTLQLFNKPGTVARFIYFLAGKIREWKIKGIIISLKKGTDDSLLNELVQFCDKQIYLGGD